MLEPMQPVSDFIGLECFDPVGSDFGAMDYFDSRGFVPYSIMLGAFWFEELEAFQGIDDAIVAIVPPDVFRQESISWNRRQLVGLIKTLRSKGCKVYLKISAHPFQLSAVKGMQSFEGGQQRQVWLESHPELVQLKSDGGTTDLPAVNVLKRFSSGVLFEDWYIPSIVRVLEGYDFDGFCASDGTMGLRGPKETLDITDYSEDMIAQFQEHTGVSLPACPQEELASEIRSRHRRTWSDFYRWRWGQHLHKLQVALANANKELVAVDAWSRNPIDMHYDYGLDYKLALDEAPMRVLLQSREANKWRKHREGTYVTEEASILALLSHKIRAPHVNFDWFMTLVNRAEYWHAVKDLPNVVERESYCFTTLSRYEKGSFLPVVDGFTVQGYPTDRSDWEWCVQRWNHGLALQRKTTGAVGLTLVWDETVLENSDYSSKPQFTERFRSLVNNGLCVHSVCRPCDVDEIPTQGFFYLGTPPKELEINDHQVVVVQNDAGLVVDGHPYGDDKAISVIKEKLSFYSSAGRIYAFATAQDTWIVGVENAGNLFYEPTITVTVPFAIESVKALPPRTFYLVDGSIRRKSFQVSCPPDGCVLLEVKFVV